MSSQNSLPFSDDSLSSLKDSSRILIFDEGLHVLHATFKVGSQSLLSVSQVADANDLECLITLSYELQVQQAELEPLTKVFGDREQAVRNGMSIQGRRYEVSI